MNLIFAAAPSNEFVVTVSGKTSTDKKLSVLNHASREAVRVLAHGKGKVAKVAKAASEVEDMQDAVGVIAKGGFDTFAAIVAATLGESVAFRTVKDAETGKVVKKASDAFIAFGNVIEHKLLQLESANKMHTAKGDYSAAALALLSLQALHTMAVEGWRENQRIEGEKIAALRAKLEADAQGEKGLIEA